jgi:hypothetical protein
VSLRSGAAHWTALELDYPLSANHSELSNPEHRLTISHLVEGIGE